MNEIDRIFAIAAMALAMACGLALTPASAEDKSGESASFFETFNSVSPERWFISNGWTNGAHQNCTWSAKNFRDSGGALELILSKNGERDAPAEKAFRSTPI